MKPGAKPDQAPRRVSRHSLGSIVLRGFGLGAFGGFIVTLLYLIFR